MAERVNGGCYTDVETVLVLMGRRYYNPVTGRFLTRDPLSYEGGINLYAYCENNPVNRADASGLKDAYIFVGDYGDSISASIGVVGSAVRLDMLVLRRHFRREGYNVHFVDNATTALVKDNLPKADAAAFIGHATGANSDSDMYFAFATDDGMVTYSNADDPNDNFETYLGGKRLDEL